MYFKFQIGLPPRNFCQASRGGSVTRFSLIKRRIFSCFRVTREIVAEDPSSPWHHSGMSSQQSSMMKTRRTYNLLMLRSFFCLKQVEERNVARAASSHSHLLRFLVYLLASPSAQRNPRSCAHHPPSYFFPSSNSESHIHLFGFHHVQLNGEPMNSDCLAKVMPLSVCLLMCNLNTSNRCAFVEEGRKLQPMRFQRATNFEEPEFLHFPQTLERNQLRSAHTQNAPPDLTWRLAGHNQALMSDHPPYATGPTQSLAISTPPSSTA